MPKNNLPPATVGTAAQGRHSGAWQPDFSGAEYSPASSVRQVVHRLQRNYRISEPHARTVARLARLGGVQ